MQYEHSHHKLGHFTREFSQRGSATTSRRRFSERQGQQGAGGKALGWVLHQARVHEVLEGVRGLRQFLIGHLGVTPGVDLCAEVVADEVELNLR